MTQAAARALLDEVEQALELLSGYGDAPLAGSETLPSLLEQCEVFCAGSREPEPIRTLHHLACTGGSLFSKLISAMPNTVLLSEIDPLSAMQTGKTAQQFSPTNLIYLMRTALRPVPTAVVEQVFQAGVRELLGCLRERGQHLVLRDHSHSQFTTKEDAASRPTLREIVARELPVCSVVTVRHPLDSFLALLAHGWITFLPVTLEEYARRYSSFLDRHTGVDFFRYEDLLADPTGVTRQICASLKLPWAPEAQFMLGHVKMSGDSGRSGSVIGVRERRALPEGFHQERIGALGPYMALCERLGYSPDL